MGSSRQYSLEKDKDLAALEVFMKSDNSYEVHHLCKSYEDLDFCINNLRLKLYEIDALRNAMHGVGKVILAITKEEVNSYEVFDITDVIYQYRKVK